MGICLLDGGQSRPRKRSQVDNKRSVPTPFLYLLLIAKPWGQCGIEVAHDTNFSAIIMNVLLGIIIIGAGVTIAYFMDFTLIGDIIALCGLYLGGKIIASD